MTGTTSREIHLIRRPVGMPTADDFAMVSVTLPEPAEGEMLVRNHYISVDPYMRGRMVDRRSYVPPFELNQPMDGGCVGQVVASNGGKFAVGDYVVGMSGWREYFISDGAGLFPIDPTVAPIQSFLGAMGMPGQTAYFGLLEIGQPKEGETVFVSAAAGAVGSVVCQIAKLKGCRVIGSAGSQAKVDWLLNEIGVDAAVNYKEVESLTKAVAANAPDGIDIYFENVGGAHLETALALLNNFGRIPFCGMISQYNATEPAPGPTNMAYIIGKRLTLQGFIVIDFMARLPEFYADMATWAAEGKIKWNETVVDGIENAPAAFIGLFSGQNLGKMLVRVGETE